MKSLSDLIVGDEVVYSYGGIGVIPKIKRVDRITELHLVVSGQKFRKNSGYAAGDSRGYIAVPDDSIRSYIAEETERRKCLRKIRDTYFDRIPLDTLRQIAALIPVTTS